MHTYMRCTRIVRPESLLNRLSIFPSYSSDVLLAGINHGGCCRTEDGEKCEKCTCMSPFGFWCCVWIILASDFIQPLLGQVTLW